MSYAFKITDIQSFGPNFSEVNVRDNTFDLPGSGYSFQRNDVIHITYTQNGFKKGLYAVCTGIGVGAGFTFDQRIYPVTQTIVASSVLGATLYRGDAYTKISTVDFNVSVNRGVYSEEYKAYNVSKEYSVVVNQENRRFFDSFDDVAFSDKMILADYCENYAYGVSYDEETFSLINNRFATSLVFNVATR